jgi:hypothetical protein
LMEDTKGLNYQEEHWRTKNSFGNGNCTRRIFVEKLPLFCGRD